MNHLKSYNESLRDKMTPKSEKEVLGAVDSFIKNTEEQMDNGEDFTYDDALEIIEYIKQIKKIDTNELVHLIVDEIDSPIEDKLSWILGVTEDTYGYDDFDPNTIQLLLDIMRKK